jgi:polysaccharide export outer membrane protein
MKNRTATMLLLLSLSSTACLAGQDGQETATAPQMSPDRIGPNDSITVFALEADEISKTWRVNDTGDLDLPLVGKIHAAGLTVGELEGQLAAGLKQYIRNPQVSVFIAEGRSRPVTVAGAVHRPATFEVRSGTTLLATIQMAGGLDAPGATLILTREAKYGIIPLPEAKMDADGQHSSAEVAIAVITDPTSAASRLEMQPHDVVSVLNQKRLVYVIGEVNRPGAVELSTQNTVSVMQILAAAGGITKLSSPGKTQIMRLEPSGVYKPVGKIDLKAIMTGRQEDRLLSSGDILVVPSSALKGYAQMASASAVSTGVLILTRF